MDSKFKLIIDSFGKDRFKFNEPLKDYTALKVGGPAKLFFISFTTQELVKIIKISRELKLSYFVFGTGSKMMISDTGFDGLVIKNRTKEIRTKSVKGKVTKYGIGVEEALIEVDSGVSLAKFCEYLDSQNLSTEGLKDMTGSVGGNLILSRFLQTRSKSIKVLDLQSEIDEISIDNLKIGKDVILSAHFKIKAKL